MAAPTNVVVHPLVLLSVVDHYNRVAKVLERARSGVARPARVHPAVTRRGCARCGAQDTRKRVVGILLGESHKGRLDVTNSYAGARGCPAGAGRLLPPGRGAAQRRARADASAGLRARRRWGAVRLPRAARPQRAVASSF